MYWKLKLRRRSISGYLSGYDRPEPDLGRQVIGWSISIHALIVEFKINISDEAYIRSVCTLRMNIMTNLLNETDIENHRKAVPPSRIIICSIENIVLFQKRYRYKQITSFNWRQVVVLFVRFGLSANALCTRPEAMDIFLSDKYT